MRLDIRSLGFSLTEGLREHVERSLVRAFSHGRRDLVEVQVRLSDQNGPRGGADKRCVARARFAGDEHVVIERRHHDLYTAIAQAIETLGQRSDARRQRVLRGRRVLPATRAHMAG
jgi:putative sigma-54 modulation protein